MERCWSEDLAERVRSSCGATLFIGPNTNNFELAQNAANYLGINVRNLRFKESEAVQAVVRRRVDLAMFRSDLERYFSGALNHFATAELKFADVKPLDFRQFSPSADLTELRNALAGRIYEVRCAITHSKETKSRYSPYRDDLDLAREIPLVRLVAEQLLIHRDDWL